MSGNYRGGRRGHDFSRAAADYRASRASVIGASQKGSRGRGDLDFDQPAQKEDGTVDITTVVLGGTSQEIIGFLPGPLRVVREPS